MPQISRRRRGLFTEEVKWILRACLLYWKRCVPLSVPYIQKKISPLKTTHNDFLRKSGPNTIPSNAALPSSFSQHIQTAYRSKAELRLDVRLTRNRSSPSSEPRFDDQYGWLISISSRKAINVSEVAVSPLVDT